MTITRKPTLGENRILYSFTSAVDMTSNQYGLVQLYASDTVSPLTVTANTLTGNIVIGIQENLPDSGTGAEIRVCLHGITLAKLGEALTAGALLTCQTNSSYCFASTGSVGTNTMRIVGRALRSGIAGEIIPIYKYDGNSIK